MNDVDCRVIIGETNKKKWRLLLLISQQFVQFETYFVRLYVYNLRPATLHPFAEFEKSKTTTFCKPLFNSFIRPSQVIVKPYFLDQSRREYYRFCIGVNKILNHI